MEKYIFFAILLFYIYRFIVSTQKKAKQEAEQRRQLNEEHSRTQPHEVAKPRTLEEILTDVFRETEMQTKPFGDGRKQVSQPKPNTFAKKKSVFQPVTTVKSQPQKKKQTSPFLTTDYSPEAMEPEGRSLDTIEPEGTPSHLLENAIGTGQFTDVYNQPVKKHRSRKFNAKEAVIAKIILDRPEW